MITYFQFASEVLPFSLQIVKDLFLILQIENVCSWINIELQQLFGLK